MAINDLIATIPPPTVPTENGPTERWAEIETSLGIALPREYREFGLQYGSGRFCKGFIEVFNPFDVHYLELVQSQCSLLKSIQAAGMELPHDPFPAFPGLLPWGRDENGHMMCWLTEGKPDQWPIILRRHENVYETWKLSLTSFLVKAFRNEIRCILWQDPFCAKELTFEPVMPPQQKKKRKRK